MSLDENFSLMHFAVDNNQDPLFWTTQQQRFNVLDTSNFITYTRQNMARVELAFEKWSLNFMQMILDFS